ncbi:MAG: hypothetical protein N2C14_31355, partial [Planctomycetales bacterium]
FHLLTGQPPFRADDVIQTLLQVMHNDPPSPRSLRAEVHPDLETICLKCLEKDPKNRFESAQALADELDRVLKQERIHSKRQGPFVRLGRLLMKIPVIQAIIPPPGESAQHHPALYRLQLAVIVVGLLLVVAVAGWMMTPRPMPSVIRVAAAKRGTVYFELSEIMTRPLSETTDRPVEVLATEGSQANRELLQADAAELALMQACFLGNQAVVVAPLYYEDVFLVVRDEIKNLDALKNMNGAAISLGPEKSGNRRIAGYLLEYFDFDVKQLTKMDVDFGGFHSGELDAAVIVTNTRNQRLRTLLNTKGVKLLSIPRRDVETLVERHPILRSHELTAAMMFDVKQLQTENVLTVRVPTVLTVREDASPAMVRAVLELLYGELRFAENNDLLLRAAAARWRPWTMHETAERFFDSP